MQNFSGIRETHVKIQQSYEQEYKEYKSDTDMTLHQKQWNVFCDIQVLKEVNINVVYNSRNETRKKKN